MTTAVIVDAIRTPLGKRNGKLKELAPGRPRRRDAATRSSSAPASIPGIVDDVVMGCVMQVGRAGRQRRPQRSARRRLARDVPGTTIDRQCGSSQQAAHFAAQGVIAGAYDVVVAAGVEVMTRVPMGSSMVDGKFGFPFGPKVGARYAAVGGLVPQGISAELIADKWGITREDMDRFGVRSPGAAPPRRTDEGRFQGQILPVLRRRGQLVTVDEGSARDDDGDAGRAEAGVQAAEERARSPPATRRRSPTAPRRC